MTMTFLHLGYAAIGVALTIWVATVLKRNGHTFLARHYRTPEMADSLSDLLTVGFYLVHIGCLLLALRYGGRAADATEALEVLSSKLGLVLVVLALSHFLHCAVLSKLNSRREEKTPAPPVADAAVLDAELVLVETPSPNGRA